MNEKLLKEVVHQFSLNPRGIHGIEHWIRVYENGHRLAQETGANIRVLAYFAVLHDCQRVSNAGDRDHGLRAARYARKHRRDIDLSDKEFDLLVEAVSLHTRGCRPEADITVQTCLDADRLDIARTGCIVDQAHLYTEAAISETSRSKNLRFLRARQEQTRGFDARNRKRR